MLLDRTLIDGGVSILERTAMTDKRSLLNQSVSCEQTHFSISDLTKYDLKIYICSKIFQIVWDV